MERSELDELAVWCDVQDMILHIHVDHVLEMVQLQ